jgi:hypothetical protein
MADSHGGVNLERRSHVTLGFILIACIGFGILPCTAFPADGIALSHPIQLTTDPHYDRNPSILLADDGTYWLFFTRGKDPRGIRGYEGYDPDSDYYDIYYMTARSLPGLLKATEKKVPGTAPDNARRDVAALQSGDGTIWVFASTGLGPGSERSVYSYRFKAGSWSGPTAVPGTDYAAHVDAIEKDGRIWVFYDVGYELFVTSYRPRNGVWTTPVLIAPGATVAKALAADGMFYVAWVYVDPATSQWGPGIYLSASRDGSIWKQTSVPVAAWGGSLTNWDPALVEDHKSVRLYWAPSDTEQFIATTSSRTPMDPASWSTPARVTKASGNGNSWWDFWPAPVQKGRNEGGALALLYTSERNSDGTAMIDGNIWLEITIPRGREG